MECVLFVPARENVTTTDIPDTPIIMIALPKSSSANEPEVPLGTLLADGGKVSNIGLGQ
jgi:hypothetical protein